jgi:CelD/BcsL family acetyltransferase involved in cellulose biosynthesis
MAMTVTIRPIKGDEDARWDDFVLNHPGGNVYHHSLWRQVLQATYGYDPLYLVLEDSATKEFQGVFPVMHIKSALTGERLISLPFSTFCSLLVDDCRIAELVQFVMEQHPKAEFFALKLCDSDNTLPDILHKDSSYVTHFLDISIGETALLEGFHPTSVRQRINRARREKRLTLRWAQGEEDVKNFFRLHTRVRKKHGLPPHPYDFFLNIWRLMAPKQMVSIPFIECDGKMIAASVVLKYKDTVSYEYSATDEEYLSLSANQLLAWEVIRMACGEGLRVFDFGRSSLDNQSLIDYKDRWGAKKCALNYYYYPNIDRLGAEGSFGRRLLTRVNSLLPEALLQLEGKYLYRHLG